MSNPDKSHFRALDRIWGYLNNKPNLGLYYKIPNTTVNILNSSNNKNIIAIPGLIGHTDAAYADDLIVRRSTTAYIFFLFGIPISWYTTLQKI